MKNKKITVVQNIESSVVLTPTSICEVHTES